MFTIDNDKVVELVCLYARLPKSRRAQAAELAQCAASYLCSKLIREPENAKEATAVCHAAACIALCDMARLGAAALEPAVTETGVFSANGKSNATSEEAEKLKKDALARLGDMLEENETADDFYFQGVDNYYA